MITALKERYHGDGSLILQTAVRRGYTNILNDTHSFTVDEYNQMLCYAFNSPDLTEDQKVELLDTAQRNCFFYHGGITPVHTRQILLCEGVRRHPRLFQKLADIAAFSNRHKALIV